MDAPTFEPAPHVTAYPEYEDAIREDDADQAEAAEPAPEPAPRQAVERQEQDPDQYNPRMKGLIGDLTRQRERARLAEERAAAAEARARALEELDAAVDAELDAEEAAVPPPGLADDPQAYFDHRFSNHEARLRQSIEQTVAAVEYRREQERYDREMKAWHGQIQEWGAKERQRLTGSGEDLDGAERFVVEKLAQNWQVLHPEADPNKIRRAAVEHVANLYAQHFQQGRSPYPSTLAMAKNWGFVPSSPTPSTGNGSPGKRKSPPPPAAVAQRAARAQATTPVVTGAAVPATNVDNFAALSMDQKIAITNSLPPGVTLYEYLMQAQQESP